MKWSKLGAFVALISHCPAWAGACCVGSTASTPARVGECETAVIAVSTSGERVGRWTDDQGAVRDSSVVDQAVVVVLGGGYRVNRQLQVGLSAPLRMNRFSTAQTSVVGGGLGDVRLTGLWDPFEEKATPDRWNAPMPILTTGLRLPTGRDWTESRGELFEDVTGVERPAILAGASVERTLNGWPWSVGVSAELGFGVRGLQPVVVTSGNVGKYLGSRWTVSSSLVHRRSWASLAEGAVASLQTDAGLSLIRGVPGAWRGWLAATSPVPVQAWNRSAGRRTTVSVGAAVVI